MIPFRAAPVAQALHLGPCAFGAHRAAQLVGLAWAEPDDVDGDLRSLPVYDDTTLAGWRRWLLVRRSLTASRRGEHELACQLCCAPTGTVDDDLIRVAGTRWVVEDCFRTAKTEVGLDRYQVRRYDARYRHATLAMLARTYLAVIAAITAKAPAAT